VFCAAPCTFSPIKVSIHQPLTRALTTIHIGKTTPTVAQTVGAEAARSHHSLELRMSF
jgi:hypothetical protein